MHCTFNPILYLQFCISPEPSLVGRLTPILRHLLSLKKPARTHSSRWHTTPTPHWWNILLGTTSMDVLRGPSGTEDIHLTLCITCMCRGSSRPPWLRAFFSRPIRRGASKARGWGSSCTRCKASCDRPGPCPRAQVVRHPATYGVWHGVPGNACR